MKNLLITAVFTTMCFFTCLNFYGQTTESNSTNNYNIPPGVVFAKKFITTLDLSYKLNGSPKEQDYKDSELRVGKNLSVDQLESLKDVDSVNYQYYTTANSYFNKLSQKIKDLYTVNELWYIYVFDQNLKNKLLTIK